MHSIRRTDTGVEVHEFGTAQDGHVECLSLRHSNDPEHARRLDELIADIRAKVESNLKLRRVG